METVQQEQELNVAAQYGRVKGASWFPLLYKKDVMVLGQGGIGSWVSLLLSRIGCNLYLFDMDTYEEHNMTGQVVRRSDLNKNKAQAAKSVIQEFSPDAYVVAYGECYTEDSFAGDIMVCGFDNMEARKTAFANWKRYVLEEVPPEERHKCFFQDGRLLTEQLQIYNIPGDREDLMKKYEEEALFSDEEAAEPECTFKQTSHCAAMIASMMVGFVTNWASNAGGLKPKRVVPFYHEYIIPLNLKDNA